LSFRFIRVARHSATVVITIDNKPVNALHPDVSDEILAAVEAAARDESVRAIILTGTGKHFVAGGDIAFFQTLTSHTAELYALRIQQMQNVLQTILIPVIAGVNGTALGGGCELMMACDIRIAEEHALIGQPEVGLGIIPGAGGTQVLPRLIPQGVAKRLLFTGERISAHEAQSLGLVDEVVGTGGVLDSALRLAEKISSNAPRAVAAAKRAATMGLQMSLADGLKLEATLFGALFETADAKEGVQAFLDRRKPEFRGR
jgi:enoyl-CoA hydratase/carnithine racemase